jgi:acetyl esterase/lipase
MLVNTLAIAHAAPSVYATAVYDHANVGEVIVYGQGLVNASTTPAAINLTAHVWQPVRVPGGPPVPTMKRPVIVFVHGGGFSGSIVQDKAKEAVPDVAYFVQRGFIGITTNYRLTEDNGSWPLDWGTAPYRPSPPCGVKPLAPQNASDWWGQRFDAANVLGGERSTITLASDAELCFSAGAGKSVSLQPCNTSASTSKGAKYNQWQYNETCQSLSIFLDQKTHPDPYCLTSPVGGDQSLDLSIQHCNTSDPLQRWLVGNQMGSTICSVASNGTQHGKAGSSLCVTFSGGFEPPLHNLYPAVRDAKAAVRWVRAVGAASFNIDTDYITLSGGSAGASTTLSAGIAQVTGDFTDELTDEEDPTLTTTHREESSSVRSVIAHWGAAYGVVAATAVDPLKRDRYAHAANASLLPSVLEFNGLIDTTIPIQHARSIQAHYGRHDVNGRMAIVPLPNQPHACWDANVTVPTTGETKTQSQFAFEWTVRDQGLDVLTGD